MSPDTPSRTGFEVQDIQNEPDNRGIAIGKVGVSRLRYPLIWHESDGSSFTAQGEFRLSASLDAHHRGTHMSRFVEQLHLLHHSLGLQQWYEFPCQLARVLNASRADAAVAFSLFREIAAPNTGKVGMQAVEVGLDAHWQSDGQHWLELELALPIATVCPCSREISERGAHNQRGLVTVRGRILPELIARVSLLQLIQRFEGCASVPLYPVLKRTDEKLVTEQGYDQAKFVEDVVRDVVLAARDCRLYRSFRVEVENQESIHTHNAFAIVEEENA
ncbi:GTP cyclohydrolase FolE2 [Spirochaeta africana]|uniref:GTP cyclohydrolase I n=1 Tax=Spirochaeta africana (strain ATCC 700263 / DSM 8902 / Z-7692) TaxID=889378 RepID=H9UJI3_SPIAZ|nr:GTP cyclohydrolase FolE2 [Spirochaeta africana]AFG37676.1 hypothetical protein Spiaf_1618 [Spirochaeta africana DSM 8902]